MRVLRRVTLWAGCLILSVPLLAGAAAADTSADILDWLGESVKLTEITTTSFDFQVDGARLKIPVTRIKRIDSIGQGDAMVVRFVNGDSVMGTTEDRIAGYWRLGAYALELNKARNVVFHHTTPPRWTAIVNGFEVYDLSCRFPFFGHDRDRATSASRGMPTARLPVVIHGVLYFVPFSDIEHATPTSIQLTGRPALEVSSFGRSRVVEGAPGTLVGYTKAGTFEISLDDVASIRFDGIEAVPAVADAPQTNSRALAQDRCDEIRAGIVTSHGDELSVAGLGVFTTNSGRGASSSFACRMGHSRRTVELSSLARIQNVVICRDIQNTFGWRLRITAELVAKTGAPVSAEFENPYIYFSGASDLGFAVIRAQDIASIVIR